VNAGLPVSRREFFRVSGIGLASLACLPAAAHAGRVGGGRHHSGVLSGTPRVALVGVGTVGVRLLGRIHAQHLAGVYGIAIDADELVQEAGAAAMRLVLGLGLKRGLCVGRRELDTSAAAAHRDAIAGALADADLVLVIGSLGGRMVGATAPFVAHLGRQAGALTIAIVTTPFAFEGRGRIREATDGLRDLAAVCDSTVVIPGDRSIDIVGGHRTLREAVDCRDEAVCCGVRAITGAATVPGTTCVGFADIHAVFAGRGLGVVGLGVGAGPNRAERAATDALSSPLLRDLDVGRARGVFAEVAAANPGSDEIERVTATLGRAVGDEVAMIVGDAARPELDGTMRVTVVAVGTPAMRARTT
jgi:cell division protein FtsZ